MKIKCFFISIVTTALVLAGGSALLAPQPATAAEGVLVASSHEKGRTDTAQDDGSCESRGGALAWIQCPIVMTADAALNWIDTQIQALLATDESLYNNPGMKNAWASIRNIAYIILLPIMMVMVIGTAVGIEMFSAYTVKKALPRMVAAVIFITLSWPICTFLIGFFNVIGGGILGLITSPFNSPGRVVSTLSLADLYGRGNLLLDLYRFLPTVPAAAAGIIFILFMYWNVMLLFASIAFMVLLLRSIFIVALLLLAPLAILAWIFPGNDKLWKSWWSLFSKLLVMFPLIMAILAVGRVFAVIIHDGGWGALQGTFLRPITILMVYMLPYVFIPFTFKFAGGVFATISGVANDRSKGLFDRARKGREKKRERLYGGNALKNAPEGSLAEKFNKGVQQAAHIKHAGLRPSNYLNGRAWTNINSVIADEELEHGLEAAEKLTGAKSFFAADDLMLAGLEGGGDYEKTYARLAKSKEEGGAGWTADQARIGASQAMRLRREMGGESFNLAALAKLPGTGTSFVAEDIGKWHEMIAKNTHGNKSLQASIVAQGKAGFRAAQRYEVSEAGFGDHMEAISMAEAGKDPLDITKKIVDAAYRGGGAPAVVGSRNQHSARMFAEAMKRDLSKNLKNYKATGSDDDRAAYIRSLAQIANVQDQMAGGKRLVTDVVATKILGEEIGGRTVLQQINDVRDEQAFQQARRELGRDIPPEIRAAAAQAQTGSAPPPGTPPTPPVGGGLQPPL